MDASDDRIQVMIRADHTPKWKERIHENMTCIVNNETVYDKDFQWKLCDHDKKLHANEKSDKSSHSSKGMSLWSGASQFTPIKSFVHKAKCISLNELCKVKQDMLCVTIGTTQKFFVSKHGWFYYGCTYKIFKASDMNNPYKCSCGQNVEQAIPMLYFSIDTDCANIIGKFADSIYKAMLEEGEDDPMVYLDELDMLLGKIMAFRAKGDSIPLTQNPVVDRVDDSIESLSTYGENDPDKVVPNTSSKGSPITLDVEDSECQPYGATQLSGTKP
ncbi:uncharacterized protein LOC131627597 [Vicia villosa]|uniref:uncharacterized protein LOC131627597 n=1 Tax=Vicia villosa TaxID=3911 RepID=UPI00273B052E|nr:uncharacterized protein LOC131627597 [Vicia villosa]